MTTPAQLSYLKNKARTMRRLGQKSMSIIDEDFDYWVKHERNRLSEITDNSFMYESITVRRTSVTQRRIRQDGYF